MRQLWKRRLAGAATALAVLAACLAPALAAGSQGASDWAVEGIARAAAAGFVPEELMGDWQVSEDGSTLTFTAEGGT